MTTATAPKRERWKDISGWPYQVSNHEGVRSKRRVVIRSNGAPHRVKPRILKPCHSRHPGSPPSVTLRDAPRKKTVAVERLVYQAFRL